MNKVPLLSLYAAQAKSAACISSNLPKVYGSSDGEVKMSCLAEYNDILYLFGEIKSSRVVEES